MSIFREGRNQAVHTKTMIKFSNLSIRHKLTVLLGASAAIALLISSVLTVYYTFTTQKEESLWHLRQISDIGSENITAALAFRDDASATKMLAALRANPHILAAIIHDDEARRFSGYVSSTASPSMVESYLSELAIIASANRLQLFEHKQAVNGIVFEYMYAIVPIIFQGKTIGTLTIVSDNQALKSSIIDYVAMQVLISVATLAIIILISIRLQKVFTSPILHMISAIREISETKNYSVSVDSRQNDEFKDLYSHFNTMIAEIRERDDRLIRLSTTDPLTGLANRRHAMEVMETLVIRANRRKEPFGVVAIDVDHFKRVNDTLGHPVGDAVLRGVADILARAAREYDLVARFGGEEFLILCDNSDLKTTRMIAERMRTDIECAVISYDNEKTIQVTISAGVCSTVPSSDGIDALLKVADQALYRAKEMGRNRVEIGDIS